MEGETYILMNMGACEERVPDEFNMYSCVKGGPGPIPGIKELISPPEKWGSIGKEDIVTRYVTVELTPRFELTHIIVQYKVGRSTGGGMAMYYLISLSIPTEREHCRS